MPPTTSKKKSPKTEAEDKYAAGAWGSSQFGGVQDLEVPSGQMCLVKRPGVEGLLREGVLRDIDSFTALVNTEHIEKKGKKAGKPADSTQAVAKLMQDPEKVANMMHTIDRVITHVVIKPRVEMTPNDPTRRKKDIVYADQIDINDKMFIFNFVVGGSRDIERFLEERDSALGNLDVGEAVEDSP